MERKLVLEIEELEERIAPHCWSPNARLGGGEAAVKFSPEGTHGDTGTHGNTLCVPGHSHGMDMPEAAVVGLTRATEGGV